MSLDVLKNKNFFSKGGSEYICTGFMFSPLPASTVEGKTTTDFYHYHNYKVNEKGDGAVYGLIFWPENQVPAHTHKIVNFTVEPSEEIVDNTTGEIKLGSHIHELQTMITGSGAGVAGGAAAPGSPSTAGAPQGGGMGGGYS